jgi:hypothetical protein
MQLTKDGPVISTSDTHLRCSECEMVWCDHIKQAIRETTDSVLIWTDDMPEIIAVPYVPSSDLWVEVALREPEKATFQYKEVFLVSPRDASLYDRLGTLMPGEGREVLRELVHNWFLMEIADDKGELREMVCRKTTHARADARARWKKIRNSVKSDQGPWLAEMWSITWWKACTFCRDLQQQAMDPDLVPGKV